MIFKLRKKEGKGKRGDLFAFPTSSFNLNKIEKKLNTLNKEDFKKLIKNKKQLIKFCENYREYIIRSKPDPKSKYCYRLTLEDIKQKYTINVQKQEKIDK